MSHKFAFICAFVPLAGLFSQRRVHVHHASRWMSWLFGPQGLVGGRTPSPHFHTVVPCAPCVTFANSMTWFCSCYPMWKTGRGYRSIRISWRSPWQVWLRSCLVWGRSTIIPCWQSCAQWLATFWPRGIRMQETCPHPIGSHRGPHHAR